MKPRWRQSFQGRAIAAAVATTLGMWLLWALFIVWDAGRDQSAVFDGELKTTAEVIVTAFPRGMVEQRHGANFSLPEGKPGDEFNYQVWTADRRLVSRTATTPDQPLNPDFTPGFANREVHGQRWRSYTVNDASGTIQVQVGEHVAQRRGYAQQEAVRGLLDLAFLLVALAAALVAASVWAARPLRRLRQQVEARSPTDTTALPEDGLPSEVRPLVQAFNEMLGRAEAARLAQQRFVADAAHELRTPLAALRVQAQLAERATEPAERSESLRRLKAGIARSTRVTEQLLDLARMDSLASPALQTLDSARLLAGVRDDCAALAARRSIEVRCDGTGHPLFGEPALLHVALRNLLDNALRYSPPGSEVRLSAGRDADARTWLAVQDDGPGLDESQRQTAVKPFVRLHDGDETGSGLGLSIVLRVAGLLGAELRLAATPGSGGLSAVLRLPAG